VGFVLYSFLNIILILQLINILIRIRKSVKEKEYIYKQATSILTFDLSSLNGTDSKIEVLGLSPTNELKELST
jgi:hypothetical protein